MKLLQLSKLSTLSTLSQNTKSMDHLKDIFLAAVSSVQTSNLLANNVKINGNTLTVTNKTFALNRPCHVVGFGKAAYGMATELYKILDDQIESGILSIPTDSLAQQRRALPQEFGQKFDNKFQVFEGALNNVADMKAYEAANAIEKYISNLEENDTVIVLISGGGSALLPLPLDGITLQEKSELAKNLLLNGIPIHEVNCVRTRLSKLKGGGLARAAYPAQVISLILSDVIGDPLESIASGPTYINLKKPCNPSEILRKSNLLGTVSQVIIDYLNKPLPTEAELQAMELKYTRVHNFIIGSSKIACEAAQKRAQELGYFATLASTAMSGSVQEIANLYFLISHYILDTRARNQDMIRFQACIEDDLLRTLEMVRVSGKGCATCLIFGGEPTIVVKNESGKGGRNMHLALEVGLLVRELSGVHFLSCGTDGIDGPTPSAGAVGPPISEQDAGKVQQYLDNADSYTYFTNFASEYLVDTGHTGTNVMDVHVLIIDAHKPNYDD